MENQKIYNFDTVLKHLTCDGYLYVPAATTRRLLVAQGVPVDQSLRWLQPEWHDLPLDTYMNDGGRYRRRRHASFTLSGEGKNWCRHKDKPHYQSSGFNHLNGDIARHFAPIRQNVIEDPLIKSLVVMGYMIFKQHTELDASAVELHQFRIEPSAVEKGRPTPEGIHRDGVDIVLMTLLNRSNIAGGDSRIYRDKKGPSVATFTLTDPLDMAILNDRQVFHDVSALSVNTYGQPAYRDILVATFSRQPATHQPEYFTKSASQRAAARVPV